MKKLMLVMMAISLAGGWFLPVSAATQQVWRPARAQVNAARKIGKPIFLSNSIGMKFVLIPAGSFMMGANQSVAYVIRNTPPTTFKNILRRIIKAEHPAHRVVISRPFYLQTTAVTQAQYRTIMGKNPSRFKGCDRCPVENVTWHEARDFIRRLNARQKTNKYRLPTEAEREYACRAGTTTPFYVGMTISTDQANYDGRYVYGPGRRGVFRQRTTPVGNFPPNPWGLYDMHGNVWEWCHDRFDWNYYRHSAVRDPRGAVSGNARVWRGGSWDNYPANLRSARRGGSLPGLRSDSSGFRVVRDF